MAESTCAHPGCDCKVSGDDQYCSDYCRQHGTHGGGGECQCGHPDCH